MTPTPDSNEKTAGNDQATRHPLRDGIDTALVGASDAAEAAREKAAKVIDQAKDGLGAARESLGEAYATSREKASEAYAAALEKAKSAGKSAGEGVETNPIATVLGGLALGVVFGALLPRTEREAKALGSTGAKINDLAREAAGAAREAGKAKLAELGLSPDKARESLHAILDGAVAAATSAGSAAIEKAKPESIAAKPAYKPD